MALYTKFKPFDTNSPELKIPH